MTAGHQLFYKGSTWTITLTELSQWGALAEIRNGPDLAIGDRVMIKIGNLPPFPGTVENVFEHSFIVDFEMPVNASVVAAVKAER